MGTQANISAKRPWIISPVWDTLFVVGTPALCIPAIYAIWHTVSLTDLSLLAVIIATGHHLPTFLRTYGDRAIWQRYRVRLVAVPLLLLASQAFFVFQGWRGLVLWSLAWAPWHHGMQLYGFMRIYDAKQGQTSRSAAWLDYLMCMSGFLTILLWSPHFIFDMGMEVYDTGIPVLPAGAMIAFRSLVTAVTIAIGAGYLAHAAWHVAYGLPFSRLKVVLLVLSLFTYWFAFDIAPDPVVGLAASEIFHAVQYYAIVWIYNRRVVEQGESGTGLLTFLFRPRLGLVGLYVGLVLVYGGLSVGTTYLPRGALGNVLRDLFLISALLHIYFDCFIWKVRQPRNRKYLEVDRGGAPEQDSGLEPMPLGREMRQVAYVAAVVAVLGLAQGLNRPSEAAQPGSEEAAARRRFHQVLVDVTGSAESIHALGRAHQEEGRTDVARQMYEQALRVDSELPAGHYDLAVLLFDEAQTTQQWDRIVDHLERSLKDRPTTLAGTVSDQGNPIQAETRADAHRRLGLAYQKLGLLERAVDHLRQAWEIEPPLMDLRQETARDFSAVLSAQGDDAQAAAVLRAGIELGPRGQTALGERLARLLATSPDPRVRRPTEALGLARRVCEATGYEDFDALETLRLAQEALGQRDEARQTLFRLLRLAQSVGDGDRESHYRTLLERES